MPGKPYQDFIDDLDREGFLDDDGGSDLLDSEDLVYLGDLSEPDDEDDEEWD